MAVGHDRLTPQGKKFFAEITKLKENQVCVGYQRGAKTEENGIDICDVALWNEVGTSHSPARPFIRTSVDNNSDKITSFCKAQVVNLARGDTAQRILNGIGSMQKGLIQDTIAKSKSWAVPNAPMTINLKKGSDQPLVDTGQMRQSTNYIIVKKGSYD